MEWRDMKNHQPASDQHVLLYWKETGHVEDGTVHYHGQLGRSHRLFDGERRVIEPSHWAPYESPKEPEQ